MNHYETSTTVGEQGRVVVPGVPFAPGTQVDVSITPIAQDSSNVQDDERLIAARKQMQAQFQSIQGFRQSPKISREELYDRRGLR